jgi:NADH:ubiquinone oxidoreductase subunit 2 (subunit N)
VSYLWLSEAGMLALALGAESTEAVALALILLLIQGFAFIGIFSTLSGLKSDSFGGATLNTHGLLWQQSWSVATILLSLGYLIGAPPLVSSWIKAGIWFNSANRAGYGVVLVSILALMLSFFGLMRLFRELSGHGLQKSTQGQKVRRKYPNAGEILLLFLLMLSTVFNDSLVGWAKVSLRGILW